MQKKVLVLGGTGAMGVYLVPKLVALGYAVDVVAQDGVNSNAPSFAYTNADAKDDAFLAAQLQNGYDAVVDFLLYSTEEFARRFEMLLQNTSHYIFLSTYRIYAGTEPIREDSPRLLDVSEDEAFLATAKREYSLYKAMQEDILRQSAYDNWTIVRPAITYSKRRFQLVTWEADVLIPRARQKRKILLPQSALAVQATMSWAGDVAEMLARLVLLSEARRETYTLATAEHQSWGEVAALYEELLGLSAVAVDTETYLSLLGGGAGARYQLLYDRCFDRVVDNTKILQATKLSQSDLTPLRKGLAQELAALPQDAIWRENPANLRMDAYLRERGLLL